jgi:RNA polymerase sigma-70 factor (sigma-E family)
MHSESSGKDFIDYVSAARPRLRRQAFLLCGDWHEAEDLVQDTLVIVYRRWRAVVRRPEVDGYARTVLVSRFLSVRRRVHWQREIPSADPPDHPDSSQGRSGAADLRISLEAGLRRLPPRQRAVVILHYWEDLSTAQIAATMGISEGTVASQNHKALTSLRGSLSELR